MTSVKEIERQAARVTAASEAERAAFDACTALPWGEARNEAWRAWRDAQRATFKEAADLFTLTRARRRKEAAQ